MLISIFKASKLKTSSSRPGVMVGFNINIVRCLCACLRYYSMHCGAYRIIDTLQLGQIIIRIRVSVSTGAWFGHKILVTALVTDSFLFFISPLCWNGYTAGCLSLSLKNEDRWTAVASNDFFFLIGNGVANSSCQCLSLYSVRVVTPQSTLHFKGAC